MQESFGVNEYLVKIGSGERCKYMYLYIYVCMYVYIVTSIVHHQARTVVAAPSSVVKCVWEVFVWGVVLFVCVCVCCCRGCCSLSVCVCVCDLLIFLPSGTRQAQAGMFPIQTP